jgi:hypothetical protein
MPFRLIKTKTLSILRYGAGSYVKGKWTKGSTTTVPIQAIVSPVIKQSMLQFLPENLRAKKVFRLFSNTQLKGFQDKEEKQQADEFTLNGETFRIVKVGEWESVNNFTGYEAYAIKVDSEVLTAYGG